MAATAAKPGDHAEHGVPSSPEKAGEHTEHGATASPAAGKGERKILYYRNPMGLPDTSPTPKKDAMGMDYVPVYEDEAGDGTTVRLSLDKVQKLGVRSEAAALRSLARPIRAVGTVQVDERLLQVVSMKYKGWIERLHADTTGQKVRRGQPLMEVYSPGLVLAQQEYAAAASAIASLENADAESLGTARQLAEGALLRLRNWDISESQVAQLRNKGEIRRTLTVLSPVDGVVLEKNAIKGMRFMPGEVLYRLADLSTVWLMAEVFEQDVGMVREGQEAKVTLNAIPGKLFKGRVSFIYPTLAAETRTVKVRIELPNRSGELRPALYATVELTAPTGEEQILAVPDSAVLNSGTRQVVLVERGEGQYEPRPVQVGVQGGGYVQIREGLKEGEKVVVRANFLIDAEANLKGALGHFSHK
ncbi:MAG: efflux RND transporter periplasmic adaptor subunit [Magnetococcales bacterium]|nr:efflux RND transporter periplasmic adaptor subunit [Magnetococcales bacterium]